MTSARWTTAAAAAGLLLWAGTAQADVAMQKKAKELGITSVQNCQSCHVDKMPKKGADKLNEMGQWLVDQKEARKAKEIDVAWLKEYKPKAK
jgi:mono/diheme cytochrome c family protein